MIRCSNKTYHYFFRNLANPLKIKIISCLKDKEASVTEIVEKLKVEQSKLSHALSSLKACNIVDVIQIGKKRVYSLNKKTIIPILDLIDKHALIHCKGKCGCRGKSK